MAVRRGTVLETCRCASGFSDQPLGPHQAGAGTRCAGNFRLMFARLGLKIHGLTL
jgi:hypothetical protein